MRALYPDKLASFIATAIEQALVNYDPAFRRAAIASSALIAGKVAAAVSQIDFDRQAILAAQPDEADAAIAILIGTLKAEIPARPHIKGQGKNPTESSIRKIDPARLQVSGLTIEGWAGPVAGPTFLEANYGLSRSTLYRWQRRNYVVALRSGGRKHVFPLSQFVDGRPVPGIASILAIIGNPRVAWFWLSQPSPALENRKPIDVLKLNMVDEVVEAARAHVKA